MVKSVVVLAVTTLPTSTSRCPARPSIGERIEQYSRFRRAVSAAAEACLTCACVSSTEFFLVSYSSWEMALVAINVSARNLHDPAFARDLAALLDIHGVAAERIRRDQIDVLVDLSGHTAHNRLRVFAERAAPMWR